MANPHHRTRQPAGLRHHPLAAPAARLPRQCRLGAQLPAHQRATRIDIVATADGDAHLVNIPTATSAGYTAGEYTSIAQVTRGRPAHRRAGHPSSSSQTGPPPLRGGRPHPCPACPGRPARRPSCAGYPPRAMCRSTKLPGAACALPRWKRNPPAHPHCRRRSRPRTSSRQRQTHCPPHAGEVLETMSSERFARAQALAATKGSRILAQFNAERQASRALQAARHAAARPWCPWPVHRRHA